MAVAARARPNKIKPMEESVGMDPPSGALTEKVLLGGLGSGVGDVTETVLTTPLVAPAVPTTIVSVALLLANIVPRFAVTVPLVPTGGPEHDPTLAAQETKVV
jgi:hypothetical protein